MPVDLIRYQLCRVVGCVSRVMGFGLREVCGICVQAGPRVVDIKWPKQKA